MTGEYRIRPVTLIEGHLEVLVTLGADGRSIESVRLGAYGFRGFEKLLVGLGAESVPYVSQRICGVCPVAHHIAAAKALDAALGVTPPEYAELMRKIMHLHGITQSHLLHTVFMALPDIYGVKSFREVMELRREAVIAGIEALKKCQSIVRILGGKHVHPVTAVPGGVTHVISGEDIEKIEEHCKTALEAFGTMIEGVLDDYMKYVENKTSVMKHVDTKHLALRGRDAIEFYEGDIAVAGRNGVEKTFGAAEYQEYIEEETVEYSYSKLTKIVISGSKYTCRVGPLSRMYCAGTPEYDKARELYNVFKQLEAKHGENPLLYTIARLVETAYCIEATPNLLDKLRRTNAKPRVRVEPREGEGVAAVEAPRGLLIHHYRLNRNGVVEYANIITPTVHNLRPMEEDAEVTAHLYVREQGFRGNEFEETVESIIRAYDPCVSCATHLVRVKVRKGE